MIKRDITLYSANLDISGSHLVLSAGIVARTFSKSTRVLLSSVNMYIHTHISHTCAQFHWLHTCTCMFRLEYNVVRYTNRLSERDGQDSIIRKLVHLQISSDPIQIS